MICLFIAENMAAKPRKVSYSDEVVKDLRKELVNLREEISRLYKEDELKQQKINTVATQLKESLESGVNMANELSQLKEQLQESKIRETRSRVSREFISAQLVLRNTDNLAMVRQIHELEKGIEELEASEEEKLVLLQRQKEALANVWKSQAAPKSNKVESAKTVEKLMDDVLRKYQGSLAVPEESRVEAILNEAQDNIATLVCKSEQLLDHALLQNVRRNEESDEEIVVTTVKKITRKRKFHNLSWTVTSEMSTVRGPNEEIIGSEMIVPPRADPPQLDNLNELLNSLRKDRASGRDNVPSCDQFII